MSLACQRLYLVCFVYQSCVLEVNLVHESHSIVLNFLVLIYFTGEKKKPTKKPTNYNLNPFKSQAQHISAFEQFRLEPRLHSEPNPPHSLKLIPKSAASKQYRLQKHFIECYIV